MNIGKITRLPGTRIPGQILTGAPPLDNFLRELDQQLLGSARVRLQTLAEIRDHLVEKVDHLVESGMAEDEALQQAIRSSDSPAELANPQRAALTNKFLKMGLFTGILFGLFMGIFFSAYFLLFSSGRPGTGIFAIFVGAGAAIFGGPCYGFWMGWFTAFIQPERELPSTAIIEGADSEGTFRVRLGKRLICVANLIGVINLLAAIFIGSQATAQVFHIPLPEVNSFRTGTWWFDLLVAAAALFNFFLMRCVSREYRVCQAGIGLQGFLRRRKFFPWANLKRVGLLRDIYWWVPFTWKNVRYAEFENGQSKKARLLIHPAEFNADRLFLLMEQKTRSHHHESAPSASRPDRQIGENPIRLAEEAE